MPSKPSLKLNIEELYDNSHDSPIKTDGKASNIKINFSHALGFTEYQVNCYEKAIANLIEKYNSNSNLNHNELIKEFNELVDRIFDNF
jgi:hypothetical protein